MVKVEDIKKLREETQASFSDVKKALEESRGDYKKALGWLKKRGIEKAEKKLERETSQGLIEAYVHGAGKIGVLVKITCETDFVARTDEFKNLAHELAMQVSAMDPKNVDDLMKQEYIRDGSMTVEQLIKQEIGKLGENIVVKEFFRSEL